MKKLFILMIFTFIAINIFSGDVANFVNLGFSPDGRYFLFGEHGVKSDEPVAYANMWLVDVKNNSFVKGGVFSGSYKTEIEPGESSLGALLKLLQSASAKINKYKIDFLDQGRPLYIRINEDTDVDKLNFRDFPTGRSFKLSLDKDVSGSDSDVASSFKIDLEILEKSGSTRNITIGNPNYKRKGVNDYKILRVLNNESGDSIVIVVSKRILENGEINERYMVETVSLK